MDVNIDKLSQNDPADAETQGVNVLLGPLNKFQRALKKLKQLTGVLFYCANELLTKGD